MRAVILSVVFLIGAGEAFAQAVSSAQAPIEISASRSLEWNRKAKTYTANDNVLVKQGALEVAGDKLIASYNDDKGSVNIWQLEASGHVVLKSPPYTAYGDRAVYDVARNKADLTGNALKIETETEYLTAKDKIEFIGAENRLSAIGSATAVRADDTLKADKLEAFFVKGTAGKMSLNKITATGKVVIDTGKETVYGDSGVYDVPAEKAVMNGRVKILQGENWLEGTRADVDMKTGISHLYAPKDGASEGRVKGMFYPKTMKNPK